MNLTSAGRRWMRIGARDSGMAMVRKPSSLRLAVAALVVFMAMLQTRRRLRSDGLQGEPAMVPGTHLRGWRSHPGAPGARHQRSAVPNSGASTSGEGVAADASKAIALPLVEPAPSAGLAQNAAAAVFTPMVLLALMALSPFVKDAEAAVVRLLPAWLQKLLRKVPLTWELFSAWEFGMTVLAVVFVQPKLMRKFLADEGLKQLRYGSRPNQSLMLFGDESSAEARPLVVFVHGGSWSHSRHWMYRLVGRRLAARGFSTAVLGYGQYPKSTVQEMVDDINTAVEWLQRCGSQHCVDASRIFLLGHSSGGHLCALAALAGGGTGVSGIAALSSPMDIADHYAWEQGRGVADISALYPAHGGESNFADFSPTQLVSQLPEGAAASLLPPFFIGHGTDDFTVPPEASERFIAALTGAGGTVEARRWSGLGHFSILGALMGFPSPAEAEAAAEDLEAFMRRCLDGSPSQEEAGTEAARAEREVPSEAMAPA